MNFDGMARFLAHLTFREGLWLFPLAFTLHVLEEVPRFTLWAQRYASERFTWQDYIAIHRLGGVVALLSPAVIGFFPAKAVVFMFFAFVFTPAVFFNTLFHAGATAISGVYCPGLLTALTLYVPLFSYLSRLAFREGLLHDDTAIVALVIAGVFHAAEVGHNVFKRW
jgi:hypothetical protein